MGPAADGTPQNRGDGICIGKKSSEGEHRRKERNAVSALAKTRSMGQRRGPTDGCIEITSPSDLVVFILPPKLSAQRLPL